MATTGPVCKTYIPGSNPGGAVPVALDANPVAIPWAQIHEDEPRETARDVRLAVDGEQPVADSSAPR